MKPITPNKKQIKKFNDRFEDGRAKFLKEQYLLGNIFINEFGGIEMCWPIYMNITGINENNTEIRKKHKNKIYAALRKEGYACGEYHFMGYFLKEELSKPNFLINNATKLVINSENTRNVLIEKTITIPKTERKNIFQDVLEDFQDVLEEYDRKHHRDIGM